MALVKTSRVSWGCYGMTAFVALLAPEDYDHSDSDRAGHLPKSLQIVGSIKGDFQTKKVLLAVAEKLLSRFTTNCRYVPRSLREVLFVLRFLSLGFAIFVCASAVDSETWQAIRFRATMVLSDGSLPYR